MGLNTTPSAERTHIGFFGCCNAGKSSLVNAVTGQELAVISEIRGTTTDPVTKTMELLPLGPVVIIDTPGFDDEGALGEKRILKTKQILNRTDIAVLVVDACKDLCTADREIISLFEQKNIPYLIAMNKSDICKAVNEDKNTIRISAATGYNITEFKERLARLVPEEEKKYIVSDLIPKGSVAVLVTPIDESAPKGRMILPQQQTIRDIIDGGSTAVVCRETELKDVFSKLASPPDIVITDSQVFSYVKDIVPEDVPLTSFSILMARYKGFLHTALKGIDAVKNLKNGDTVLIAEGCTHHRQCNDIGTVKIPNWLREFTDKDIKIKTCSGRDFPDDLSEYALVIHCGGCMIGEKEVQSRMKCAIEQNIPFTNYGTLIAHINGILERSTKILLNS